MNTYISQLMINSLDVILVSLLVTIDSGDSKFRILARNKCKVMKPLKSETHTWRDAEGGTC